MEILDVRKTDIADEGYSFLVLHLNERTEKFLKAKNFRFNKEIFDISGVMRQGPHFKTIIIFSEKKMGASPFKYSDYKSLDKSYAENVSAKSPCDAYKIEKHMKLKKRKKMRRIKNLKLSMKRVKKL